MTLFQLITFDYTILFSSQTVEADSCVTTHEDSPPPWNTNCYSQWASQLGGDYRTPA